MLICTTGEPKTEERMLIRARIENHLSVGFEELFTSLRCQASLLKFCDCRGNLLVHNVLVSLNKPTEHSYCFFPIGVVIVFFLVLMRSNLRCLHSTLVAYPSGGAV